MENTQSADHIPSDDYSGYDEQGQPMYRATGDGPQCSQCGLMNGSHEAGCLNGVPSDDPVGADSSPMSELQRAAMAPRVSCADLMAMPLSELHDLPGYQDSEV